MTLPVRLVGCVSTPINDLIYDLLNGSPNNCELVTLLVTLSVCQNGFDCDLINDLIYDLLVGSRAEHE